MVSSTPSPPAAAAAAASTSASASTSSEAVDNKTDVAPSAESSEPTEPSATLHSSEGTDQALGDASKTCSPSKEALADAIDKLAVNESDPAVGGSEAAATADSEQVSDSAPQLEHQASEDTDRGDGPAENSSTDVMQAEDTVDTPITADKPHATASAADNDATTSSPTQQPDEDTHADAPTTSAPSASTAVEDDAAEVEEQAKLAETSTEASAGAEKGSVSSAQASSPPPAPFEKDTPPAPASKEAAQMSVEDAVTDVASPSTPAAAGIGRSERAALADPESVAAVAHAFGRESPALRSSTDTPKRVATPVEPTGISKPAQSSGADADAAKSTATEPSDQPQPARAPRPDPDAESEKTPSQDSSASRGGIKIGKGPPPATQASEEVPFDFNRFLEQMKHRSAQPVAEYVRSFIKGFAKKPYRTQDQIKLIFDFLDFIAARMRECDVWRNLGETDFENAKEAMEKLVMNRLYPYTFTPAVQKEGRWAVQTDDLERDRVLQQRIALFGWLKEEHLDVPVGDHSRGFIEFSIQELLKINHYKAPRDKLICILNCCKVIFGMIRHLSTQENADTFIPVLIFVVLKANPEHLISNVEYISRFRNPDRLSSESGYYLSSLMGAIAFIETMDYTSLSNITQDEFEKRVEEAVSSLPEPEPSAAVLDSSLRAQPSTPPPRGLQPGFGNSEHQRSVSGVSVSAPSGPGEEAAKALPFTPMAASLADDTRAFFLRTGEAARTGLSRPMGALGRLINEGIEGIRTPSSSNNESGASTERHNSPAPGSGPSSAGMTQSTSRSKLFGGLFGSLDTSDAAAQERARSAGYPGQQGGRRPATLLDDEPQTPSTGDLAQDGFHPYQAGGAGGMLGAPPRLVPRPNMPQRNYSIDEAMFDDESAGRRNLMAASAGSRAGRNDADYMDSDDEEDRMGGSHADRGAPNAAAAEYMRRRMQMQQDFGTGVNAELPSTPSRRAGYEGMDPSQLQPGRREEVAMEHAQTEQAIQRSLMDQNRLEAMQADEAAQNSASMETLKSIFPSMDDALIQMVLQGCENNVETAIDRLLEMQ